VQGGKRTSVAWARPDEAPAIFVGVFGKHPGWDDHIDDLGLETDRLVRVRQKLYTEGVAGNIDAGAWEKLENDQRLPGFGHEMVWRSREGVVVGRLWASRDGKGRTKYPMAVVAHVQGVSAWWVDSVVMPRLAEVERACAATDAAVDVRRIVDEARVDLRTALPAKSQPFGGVATPAELGAVADRPELGPERVGLCRALYEIERELGAFRPASGETRRPASREMRVGAQHLRVPACADTTVGAAGVWAGILNSQIDAEADVIVLRPHAKPWVDLIVGEPAAPQVFCVRVSENGLALVTSVPYTLAPEFVGRCDALVKAWKAGLPAPNPEEAAPSMPEPRAGAESDEAPRKRPRWLLWGGAGAVALAAGGYFGYQQLARPLPGPQGAVALDTGKKNNGSPVAAPAPVLAPELKARQDEAKARITPEADETARQERERKAREELDRVAQQKDAADRAAREEQDRLAREKADTERKAGEERARLAKVEADRKAIEESDRIAREAADAVAREKAASDRRAEAERVRLARDEADRSAQEVEKGKAALAAAARQASELIALLDSGSTLSDPAGAESVGARAAALAADPQLAGAKDAPELVILMKRVKSLEAIAASNDGAALARQAGDTAAGLAEAITAWSRLASGAIAGWPSSAGDIAAGSAAIVSIRSALAASPDKAQSASVSRRMDEQARAVWTSSFSRLGAGDAAAIDGACSVRGAFGVQPGELPPRERFNVALNEFKRKASGLIDVKDVPALAASFAGEVTAMGADVAGRTDVESVLAALSAAGAPGVGAAAGGDPTLLGPGSRGWKGENRTASGRRAVEFTWSGASGPHTIEFVRVETAAGPAYLATTEVSVGLFADTVESAAAWAEVLPTLRGFRSDSAPEDIRSPRTWQFESSEPGPAKRIGVARANGDLGRGWIPVGARTRGTPYYPDAEAVPTPTPASPIQHVSPYGAAFVANLLGCRLPTSVEWAAAQEMNAGASANRRDAAWRRLVDYLLSKPDGVQNDVIWPDAGQGAPESMSSSTGDETYPVGKRAEAAVTEDDGTIWFQAVGQGAGDFKHLVGNVAEFVVEGGAATTPDQQPSMNKVRAALGKLEAVRMIGASALSAREVNPTQAYPPRWTLAARRGGFSDVGFRLAFSAAGGEDAPPSGAERLETFRRAASELKYLSP